MDKELCNKLCLWASRYHTTDFIGSDPICIPHRYQMLEDIEISALMTAVLSFGSRTQILKKANGLDAIMNHAPLQYVLSEAWKDDFRMGDTGSFYRMLSFAAIRNLFEKLYAVYSGHATLENVLMTYPGNPMQKLCAFLEVSDRSPQKKINMFLRWMIRRQSPVDFGIWKQMEPAELIIPLDTHVCRIAYLLKLTDTKAYSLANAKKITVALEEVFPGDPCLGDYALFGYGVNHREV